MAFPIDAARIPTTAGSTASVNKACLLPANILAGHLLILALRSNAGDTHTTPTGWSVLFLNSISDASDDTSSAWYRVADGAEGGSVTVTCTTSLKWSAISWRITNHDSVTAPVISTGVTGTSATPDPDALTPAGGAKDFLWLWLGLWEGEQTNPPIGQPTNYINPFGSSSGIAGAIATNSRCAGASQQLNAATEDPPSWTISVSNDWSAVTIAVYPALDRLLAKRRMVMPKLTKASWARYN